jgi:hypothetical protein
MMCPTPIYLPAVSVECEVLSALMRNLRQEKSLALMMRGFFFGQELNILQAAKTLVYSYPFFPDVSAGAVAYAAVSGLEANALSCACPSQASPYSPTHHLPAVTDAHRHYGQPTINASSLPSSCSQTRSHPLCLSDTPPTLACSSCLQAVAIIAALQSDLQVQQLHQGGALGALALTGL